MESRQGDTFLRWGILKSNSNAISFTKLEDLGPDMQAIIVENPEIVQKQNNISIYIYMYIVLFLCPPEELEMYFYITCIMIS